MRRRRREKKRERKVSLSFSLSLSLSLSLSFSLSRFFYAANFGVFIEKFPRAGMRTGLSRTNEIERMQERHTVVRFTIDFAAM